MRRGAGTAFLQKRGSRILLPLPAFALPFPALLIDHHQTVIVVRIGPLAKGLNRKTVVPGCLININPATFHRRSGFPGISTGIPLQALRISYSCDKVPL